VGPKAQGIIRKRERGWPATWPKLEKLKEPGQLWLDRFERYTLLAMEYACFVEEYQWDFDIEKWLEYTNICMPDEQRTAKFAFGMKRFRECIYHYAKNNNKWT
jgi:hypothetical protein